MPHVRLVAACAVAWATLALAACTSDDNFLCDDDSRCVREGEQGVCEPIGFCSFVDADCSSGRRYDESAGNGFANVCVGAPDLEIEPQTLSFGGVVVNDTGARLTARVSNVGEAPIAGLSAVLMGANAGDFQITADNCTGSALGISESCTIDVVFVPGVTGTLAGRLQVGNDTTAAISELTGMSFAPSALAVDTGQLDFGMVQRLSTPSPRLVTVSNTGELSTGALNVSITGADRTNFSVGGACLGQILGPNESCQLEIGLDSVGLGANSASVVIQDASKPQEAATIGMSGVGFVRVDIDLDTDPLAVGSVTANASGLAGCNAPGASCTASFTKTPVTLTATGGGDPTSSAFWGSPVSCSSGGATCTLDLSAVAQTSATARFSPRFRLTVVMDDSGTNAAGSVSGIGINCTLDSSSDAGTGACAIENLTSDVLLTADAPNPDFKFDHWDGAGCSFGDTCQITRSQQLTTNIVVNAVFDCEAGTGQMGPGGTCVSVVQ